MITSVKNKLRTLLPESIIDLWHKTNGVLAALIYQFPTRGMKVIGITGTNGKTTTAHLVTSIFSEAGFKVAMATTINFQIGNKSWKNNQKLTTHSPFALQKFLRKARQEGCNVAVLEVTSHALVQHRLWGIKFDTTVFTNITHDHLDYHKTLEKYLEAKKLLFANTPRVSVINADDKRAKEFLKLPAGSHFIYSLTNPEPELERYPAIVSRKIIPTAHETMFTAVTPAGQVVVNNQLPGRFNISNALAAIATAVSSNIPFEAIKKGIEHVTLVRGRMEKIDQGQSFTVIIDYAHTPDAFEKIFEAVSSIARQKIIAVHGATGARDKTKRPILGALSGRFADVVIITNEDPYHENPLTIMEQVAAGVTRGAIPAKRKELGQNFFLIEDRRQAIHKAMSIAQKGDVVLILGKGAEEVMAIGDEKANHGFRLIPWDERKIVIEELHNLGFRAKSLA